MTALIPRRQQNLPRPDDLARALARNGVRSLHLELSPRGASVTLELDGPDVLSSCTCGSGVPCPHVVSALEALGAEGSMAHAPEVPAAVAPIQLDTRQACLEVARAVAVSGCDQSATEVRAALEGLSTALRVDFRPDARRAYGRLEDALQSRKLRKLAQTILKLWAIGRSAGDPERRSEVLLAEVGRDTGSDALGRWDETYFVDLAKGDLLVEGSPMVTGRQRELSTGPFPRMIFGQLVDIDQGPPPRRVLMIQYEPRAAPGRPEIDRLVGHAFADLKSVLRAAAQGTSLVLARTARLGTLRGEAAIVDRDGNALPLAAGARALTAALVDLAEGGTLRAVLGRVGIGTADQLQIRPIAAVVDHRLVRLA